MLCRIHDRRVARAILLVDIRSMVKKTFDNATVVIRFDHRNYKRRCTVGVSYVGPGAGVEQCVDHGQMTLCNGNV